MKIHVTKQDIESGVEASPGSCPIARALCRQLGGTWCVGTRRFGRIEPLIDLPDEAKSFIFRFDRGGASSVEPFSFEVPCKAVKGVKHGD